MQRMLVVLAAAVALMAGMAANAVAQDSGWEIIPTVGFRWGGGMESIPGLRDFDTQDNIAYGIGIGRRVQPSTGVEIAWTHFQGDVDITTDGGLDFTGGPLKRDDILLNGTWYKYTGSNTMPFFTLGAGASIFASENVGSETKFAWDLGLGVRHEASDKTAVRFSVRWMPMWVTTGSGVWCDPFFCYATDTGESYDQFEVQGALIFKL